MNGATSCFPRPVTYPLANSTQTVRREWLTINDKGPVYGVLIPTWVFVLERVTGIEPTSRAWEPIVLPWPKP